MSRARAILKLAVGAGLGLLGAGGVFGQGPTTFQYFYDDLNQLVKVVDSTGVVIQYVYDPAGNIQQILRSTIASGTLTIFNITPLTTSAGATITIQGQGFNAIPAANTVLINGVIATVVMATSSTLTILVPDNAMTGVVSVTVAGVTVSSPAVVTILPLPTITLMSRKSALFNAFISNLIVTGKNFIGAIFTFGTPALAVKSASINSVGTSATLTLQAGSLAGTFTLIATNSFGSSTPTATAANRFTVVDPNSAAVGANGVPAVVDALAGVDPLDPNAPIIIASAPVVESRMVSVLDALPPTPTQPFTHVVQSDNISVLNSASPISTQPFLHVTTGLKVSMLNGRSPAPTTPTMTVAEPPLLSILNGTVSSPTVERPLLGSLRKIGNNPLTNDFIQAALARGAKRVDNAPGCLDSDGDGLCDEDELILGTDPFKPDTDGDGYPDGLELALGSDPLNPFSLPDINLPHYSVSPLLSISNFGPLATRIPLF